MTLKAFLIYFLCEVKITELYVIEINELHKDLLKFWLTAFVDMSLTRIFSVREAK